MATSKYLGSVRVLLCTLFVLLVADIVMFAASSYGISIDDNAKNWAICLTVLHLINGLYYLFWFIVCLVYLKRSKNPDYDVGESVQTFFWGFFCLSYFVHFIIAAIIYNVYYGELLQKIQMFSFIIGQVIYVIIPVAMLIVGSILYACCQTLVRICFDCSTSIFKKWKK